MREAASQDHPHDGLAAAEVRQVRRVRRLVHLPDGRGAGHRSGSSRASRRATSSSPSTTSCRSSRRTELVWKILAGGERVAWGAKTITEGGYHSMPSRLNAPGLLLVGEGAGLVNVPRLKGIHYAIESGRLAAEAAFRALQRGESSLASARSTPTTRRCASSSSWKDLHEVRNMRQAFDKGFFVGGALASVMTLTKGRAPTGGPPDASERGGAVEEDRSSLPLSDAGRHVHLRQALLGLRLGQPHA